MRLISEGIEWLNDTTLNLLFPSPSAALLALTLLSKAGFDPSEGDDPLLERSAHPIPISLLPQAGLEPEDSKAGTELLDSTAGTVGDIRRKGRGGFGGSGLMSDSVSSSSPSNALSIPRVAEGIDPLSRITVRFAVESDKDLRQQAKQSEWYARHGRHAGKEVSGTRREKATPYSRDNRREEVDWDGGDGEEGGRELGRRIARGGRRAGGRKTAEDLDRELEGIRGGADGGQGGRRPRRGREDLDKGKSTNVMRSANRGRS